MGPDEQAVNAGLWIPSAMKNEDKVDERGNPYVEVRSPVFSSSTGNSLLQTRGVHYCKLLSPARAMEWIYVDGLRKFYSVNTLNKTGVSVL